MHINYKYALQCKCLIIACCSIKRNIRVSWHFCEKSHQTLLYYGNLKNISRKQTAKDSMMFPYPLSNTCCTWNNLTSKVIGSRELFTEELEHYIFAKNIDTHASNIRHFLCSHIIKAKYSGINLHQLGINKM